MHIYVRKGLADAERTVDKDEENIGQIQIATIERGLVEYVAELLTRLGIDSRMYRRTMRKHFSI